MARSQRSGPSRQRTLAWLVRLEWWISWKRPATQRCGMLWSRAMTTLLMLPPQTETTRHWAARVVAALPALRVVVAEDPAQATREIGDAEAAFGTISPA